MEFIRNIHTSPAEAFIGKAITPQKYFHKLVASQEHSF